MAPKIKPGKKNNLANNKIDLATHSTQISPKSIDYSQDYLLTKPSSSVLEPINESKNENPYGINNMDRAMKHIQRCSACRGRYEEKANIKKFPYLKQSKKSLSKFNSPTKARISSKTSNDSLLFNAKNSTSISVNSSYDPKDHLSTKSEIKPSPNLSQEHKSSTIVSSQDDNDLNILESFSVNQLTISHKNSKDSENYSSSLFSKNNDDSFDESFTEDEHMLDEEFDILFDQNKEYVSESSSFVETLDDRADIISISASDKSFNHEIEPTEVFVKDQDTFSIIDIQKEKRNLPENTPTKRPDIESYWDGELSHMKSLKNSIDTALISKFQEVQAAYDEKVAQNRNLSILLENEIKKNTPSKTSEGIKGIYSDSPSDRERIAQHEAEANLAFNQLKSGYDIFLAELYQKHLDLASPKDSFLSPYNNVTTRKSRTRRKTNGHDNKDSNTTPRRNLFPLNSFNSLGDESPFSRALKNSSKNNEKNSMPSFDEPQVDSSRNLDWEQYSIVTKLIKSSQIGRDLISYLQFIEDDYSSKLSFTNNKFLEVQDLLQDREAEIKKLKRDYSRNAVLDDHIYSLQSDKDKLLVQLDEITSQKKKLEYEKMKLTSSLKESNELLENLRNSMSDSKEIGEKQKIKYEIEISSLKKQISSLQRFNSDSEKLYQSEVKAMKTLTPRNSVREFQTSLSQSDLDLASSSTNTEYSELTPESYTYNSLHSGPNFLKYKQLSESNASVKNQLDLLLQKYDAEVLNSSNLANKLRMAYKQIETFEKKWPDVESVDFYKDTAIDTSFYKANSLANFSKKKPPLNLDKDSLLTQRKAKAGSILRNYSYKRDHYLKSYSDSEICTNEDQNDPQTRYGIFRKNLEKLNISNEIPAPTVDLEFKDMGNYRQDDSDSTDSFDCDSQIDKYYSTQQKNRNKIQPHHQTGRISKAFTFSKSIRSYQKIKGKAVNSEFGDLASELERANVKDVDSDNQSYKLKDKKSISFFNSKKLASKLRQDSDLTTLDDTALKIDKFTSTEESFINSKALGIVDCFTQTEPFDEQRSQSILYADHLDSVSGRGSEDLLNTNSSSRPFIGSSGTRENDLHNKKNLTSDFPLRVDTFIDPSMTHSSYVEIGIQVDLIDISALSAKNSHITKKQQVNSFDNSGPFNRLLEVQDKVPSLEDKLFILSTNNTTTQTVRPCDAFSSEGIKPVFSETKPQDIVESFGESSFSLTNPGHDQQTTNTSPTLTKDFGAQIDVSLEYPNQVKFDSFPKNGKDPQDEGDCFNVESNERFEKNKSVSQIHGINTVPTIEACIQKGDYSESSAHKEFQMQTSYDITSSMVDTSTQTFEGSTNTSPVNQSFSVMEQDSTELRINDGNSASILETSPNGNGAFGTLQIYNVPNPQDSSLLKSIIMDPFSNLKTNESNPPHNTHLVSKSTTNPDRVLKSSDPESHSDVLFLVYDKLSNIDNQQDGVDKCYNSHSKSTISMDDNYIMNRTFKINASGYLNRTSKTQKRMIPSRKSTRLNSPFSSNKRKPSSYSGPSYQRYNPGRVNPGPSNFGAFYSHNRVISSNKDFTRGSNISIGTKLSSHSLKSLDYDSHLKSRNLVSNAPRQKYPSKGLSLYVPNPPNLNQVGPPAPSDFSGSSSNKNNFNTIIHSLKTTKYSSSLINSRKRNIPHPKTTKSVKERLEHASDGSHSVVSSGNPVAAVESFDHNAIKIENSKSINQANKIMTSNDSLISELRKQMPDPLIVQSIARTMIGSYMYKVSSKKSSNDFKIRHSKNTRYFWVHPYTKILSWSRYPPNHDKENDKINKVFGFSNFLLRSKPKTIFINKVKTLIDMKDSSNSNDPPKFSIIIIDGKNSICIKAMSQQDHDMWLRSLLYLQSRSPITSDSYSSEKLSQADNISRIVSKPSLADSNVSSAYFMDGRSINCSSKMSDYNSKNKDGRRRSFLSLIKFPKKSFDSHAVQHGSTSVKSVFNYYPGNIGNKNNFNATKSTHSISHND
ncbi:Anucleate primary sterigmata protein A [Smittium mucronatum]|uniref:Anucleate primary sterigmata protein A n=1 Tax=Smittium mucronatum TaxID=133383 RepID=A0A1R0GYQ8_9FUNG|nr:Anucleate primary sterigmata protein A [Smittium mucronatum]